MLVAGVSPNELRVLRGDPKGEDFCVLRGAVPGWPWLDPTRALLCEVLGGLENKLGSIVERLLVALSEPTKLGVEGALPPRAAPHLSQKRAPNAMAVLLQAPHGCMAGPFEAFLAEPGQRMSSQMDTPMNESGLSFTSGAPEVCLDGLAPPVSRSPRSPSKSSALKFSV